LQIMHITILKHLSTILTVTISTLSVVIPLISRLAANVRGALTEELVRQYPIHEGGAIQPEAGAALAVN